MSCNPSAPGTSNRCPVLGPVCTNCSDRENSGCPTPEILRAFLTAGFQKKDMLYLILAIAVTTVKKYSNYAFSAVVEVFSVYRIA